jgi:hypothetical protein
MLISLALACSSVDTPTEQTLLTTQAPTREATAATTLSTTSPTSVPTVVPDASSAPGISPTPEPSSDPEPVPSTTQEPVSINTPTPIAAATPAPESPVCIPSGDHTGIQAALTREGSEAVLCPNAVFELGDTIFFTQDDQHVYTQGLPTDDSRALLRVVGRDIATAISAEGNDYVSIKNVIIDGNRPALGIADGALINFGRGIEDRYAYGHVVEWVRAYEPRG